MHVPASCDVAQHGVVGRLPNGITEHSHVKRTESSVYTPTLPSSHLARAVTATQYTS